MDIDTKIQEEYPDIITYDEQMDAWFFWDESWTMQYGPFATKKAAEAALDEYCKVVLGFKN